MRLRSAVAATIIFSLASATVPASDAPADESVEVPGPRKLETDIKDLGRISVLGAHASREDVPGSTQVVGPEALDTFEYSDVLRVLRRVPGVYVQEEDGYGLRPNIGIRGSGLERSSRITLMEDGVLIAPAPYAAPSAYYFPNIRRMDTLEVIKGPSTVTEGPRTTGGALNLISTPIPAARSGELELLVGQDDNIELHATYGGTDGRFGWLLETVQQTTDGFKRLDGGGDTGFTDRDYLTKLRYATDSTSRPEHSVQLKLGRNDHSGDETYLGLTEADFQVDPYRRYAGSQLDHIDTEQSQYRIDYLFQPTTQDWDLSLTAYSNEFARDWFKLGSVNGTGIGSILDDPATYATEMAWIRGADSPDDAFNLRHNNREYYSRGIQARIGFSASAGNTIHDFLIGVRIHEDQEDRLQDEDLFRMDAGQLVLTTDGAIGSQANRVADADSRALFIQDVITAGDWQFTTGLRYDDIDLVRRGFGAADPYRVAGPTSVRENSLGIFTAGVGVSHDLGGGTRVFGGVHRGSNPPGPGSSSQEERSTNYELGARWVSGRHRTELVGFLSDYANMVGTCTAASGGGCTIGDQFDAGEARVSGLEFQYGTRVDDVLGGWTLPVDLSWTWTRTRFENSFSSSFDPWGNVVAGDEFPYVPEQQLQLRAGLERDAWDLAATLSYVGETRTVAGQGAIPAGEGTDSLTVLDFAVGYQASRDLRWTLRINNLTDEVGVVARRPAGARPNLPRHIAIGLEYAL